MEEKTIKISNLQNILKNNTEIEKVIEEEINPKLEDHNGWIDFVEFKNNIIYVRFRGACSSCISTYETFDKLVKPILIEKFKGIEDVEVVNDISEELIDFARSLFGKNKNYI